jgi:hypothetical protein
MNRLNGKKNSIFPKKTNFVVKSGELIQFNGWLWEMVVTTAFEKLELILIRRLCVKNINLSPDFDQIRSLLPNADSRVNTSNTS